MKISVSLPAEDLEFLDGYATGHALGSRSAAIQQAVRALRITELGDSYAEAWAAWEAAPMRVRGSAPRPTASDEARRGVAGRPRARSGR